MVTSSLGLFRVSQIVLRVVWARNQLFPAWSHTDLGNRRAGGDFEESDVVEGRFRQLF